MMHSSIQRYNVQYVLHPSMDPMTRCACGVPAHLQLQPLVTRQDLPRPRLVFLTDIAVYRCPPFSFEKSAFSRYFLATLAFLALTP